MKLFLVNFSKYAALAVILIVFLSYQNCARENFSESIGTEEVAPFEIAPGLRANYARITYIGFCEFNRILYASGSVGLHLHAPRTNWQFKCEKQKTGDSDWSARKNDNSICGQNSCEGKCLVETTNYGAIEGTIREIMDSQVWQKCDRNGEWVEIQDPTKTIKPEEPLTQINQKSLKLRWYGANDQEVKIYIRANGFSENQECQYIANSANNELAEFRGCSRNYQNPQLNEIKYIRICTSPKVNLSEFNVKQTTWWPEYTSCSAWIPTSDERALTNIQIGSVTVNITTGKTYTDGLVIGAQFEVYVYDLLNSQNGDRLLSLDQGEGHYTYNPIPRGNYCNERRFVGLTTDRIKRYLGRLIKISRCYNKTRSRHFIAVDNQCSGKSGEDIAYEGSVFVMDHRWQSNSNCELCWNGYDQIYASNSGCDKLGFKSIGWDIQGTNFRLSY